MEENKDHNIQQFLDNKGQDAENSLPQMADDADFEAYALLYDSLQEKPAQGLSYAFKSSTIRRLELEKKQADDTTFYWILGIFSLVGISFIATMFYMLRDTLTPFFGMIDKFKGFIIIIIVAILISIIMDQRLLKSRSSLQNAIKS
ncbi:hypothetical protein KORDIASMS9_04678 [Kordia sp. SMS9]|uniref:hypothetical protein n=1 Tax=Kordia sp. SMS9 TaxID=2282170 RepID=UPI000E0D2ACE|nr:hypothetical protein [Kordia sp. SMS9]AXG72406.1 hypothetical protein KORDIASMS9_04678 [Kordia sp. SMS9]